MAEADPARVGFAKILSMLMFIAHPRPPAQMGDGMWAAV
jgi:hypothetical protein